MPPQNPYQNPMQPPMNQQAPTYSQSSKALRNNRSFLIPFVVFLVLTLTFSGLFVWAYMGRQDYKNNVTPKINDAVKVAVQQESSRKDNEFIEKEKSPVKTFKGSDTFGGITFNYPKTWSAYVVQSEKSTVPVDAYLHPDVVPDIAGKTAYALRVRVLDKTYDTHLKSLESKIKQGKITLVAYNPVKQKAVVGARLDGEVNTGQKDHMIILPLRDKTIEISTESDQFKGDFEKIVLDSLNFTP
jgi:hypothetical protein